MPTATTSRPTTARSRPSGPLGRLRVAAEKVDAATPPDRDRVVDALRVAAMLAVALGHWLLAVVHVDADGGLVADSLLAAAPWTHGLTWALQVVPLFVVVAGWSSAGSLDRHDGDAAAWVHARVRRLLLPTTAYVVALAAATPLVARLTGDATGTLVGRFLGVHVWFAATVVVVWALTPALHRAWRTLGPRLLVVVGLLVVTVDVAVRAAGATWLGWANFVLVFAGATLLGFAWHDGLLDRGRAVVLATGSGLLLAAAVASPWYPLSMVGVPGAAQSNNSPPTVCLLLLAGLHLGLVVLAAPRLRRLLDRPLAWLVVVAASRVAVTVYLWHLAAVAVVVGAALHLAPGVLDVAPLSGAWWLTRPVWLLVLALATVPLVAAAARFEQRPGDAAPVTRRRLAVGVGMAAWGLASVALSGPDQPLALAAVVAAALVGRWAPRLGVR